MCRLTGLGSNAQKGRIQTQGHTGCASLTQRRCSYLMHIIKAEFEDGRRFYYFPTPLEPTPCDSPPLHPGKLSAWAVANKNSSVRGKWGPASAPLLWWGDTSLCIISSPPNPVICKWGGQDRFVGRGRLNRTRQIRLKEIRLLALGDILVFDKWGANIIIEGKCL